jgi:hypothetical protein
MRAHSFSCGFAEASGHQIKEKENENRNYDAAITVTAAQKPIQPRLNFQRKETLEKESDAFCYNSNCVTITL